MTSREQFIKTVLSTTLFTDEEKVKIVDAVDCLSEEARAKIVEEIEGYNARTKERVAKYNTAVKEEFAKYREELKNIPEIAEKDIDIANATSQVLEDAITKATSDLVS